MLRRVIVGGLAIMLAISMGLAVGCSDEDNPTSTNDEDTTGGPELPSLLGEYDGILAYTTAYGTQDEETTEYPIAFRFSDQGYWLFNAAGADPVLCEPSGNYVFGDNVELTQVQDGCADTPLASALNPQGMFSLRMPTDSVVLTQITGDTVKVIRLIVAE